MLTLHWVMNNDAVEATTRRLSLIGDLGPVGTYPNSERWRYESLSWSELFDDYQRSMVRLDISPAKFTTLLINEWTSLPSGGSLVVDVRRTLQVRVDHVYQGKSILLVDDAIGVRSFRPAEQDAAMVAIRSALPAVGN